MTKIFSDTKVQTLTPENCLNELQSILSFWSSNMLDPDGGFYGKMDSENVVYKNAPRGLVLNSRILWTYSAAFRATSIKRYKEVADMMFGYLSSVFVDKDNGGLYWQIGPTGEPQNKKKQIYAQAFAIYGLSEYYHISRDKGALKLALELFESIERYSFDGRQNGYLEAFDEQWRPLEDMRLSSKDANEAKTMNTHLHILEAYTTLYHVSANQDVRNKLRNLIQLFRDKFLTNAHHYGLFYDEDWSLRSSEVSYGHDIEAAWLIYDAALAVGDQDLIRMTHDMAINVVDATLTYFDQDGGLFHAGEVDRITNHEKHWWPQAEAIVGLLTAFQLTKDDKYLKMANKCWSFVQSDIKDHAHGEWYWGVDSNGHIMSNEDKAGFWKCPYHNGRAMIEAARRLTDVQQT